MDEPVLVLGGGVAALSVARNLQIAGRRVEIIDPLPSPGGASFGNGGFISPDSYMPGAQPGMLRNVPRWITDPLGPLVIRPGYAIHAVPWFLRWMLAGRLDRMTRLARDLRRLHASSLQEWRRLLGAELFARYIRQDGEALLWDAPPAGAAYLREEMLRSEFAISVDVLDAAGIRDLYPGISPEVKYGIIKRGNAHTVSPAQMLSDLARLMTQEGAVFHRESVTKLVPQQDGWLVLTSTGNHRARNVVVACGVWSAQLIAPLGVKVPLESQRGYHAMLPDQALRLKIPFIHRGRGVGLTPMLEGLRVAGTIEFSGIDSTPDERRAEQAVRQAQRLFPALDGVPTTIWAGQRPATPDSLPVLGGVSSHRGLWLCFGHGSYGMTGAPPSGRLVAEMIQGKPPFLDADAYAVSRF